MLSSPGGGPERRVGEERVPRWVWYFPKVCVCTTGDSEVQVRDKCWGGRTLVNGHRVKLSCWGLLYGCVLYLHPTPEICPLRAQDV